MVQILNGIWNLEAQPVEILTNGCHNLKNWTPQNHTLFTVQLDTKIPSRFWMVWFGLDCLCNQKIYSHIKWPRLKWFELQMIGTSPVFEGFQFQVVGFRIPTVLNLIFFCHQVPTESGSSTRRWCGTLAARFKNSRNWFSQTKKRLLLSEQTLTSRTSWRSWLRGSFMWTVSCRY